MHTLFRKGKRQVIDREGGVGVAPLPTAQQHGQTVCAGRASPPRVGRWIRAAGQRARTRAVLRTLRWRLYCKASAATSATNFCVARDTMRTLCSRHRTHQCCAGQLSRGARAGRWSWFTHTRLSLGFTPALRR